MKNKMNKIAVGLSGGVDSSVAAFLLKQKGHDVIGIAMEIYNGLDCADILKSSERCVEFFPEQGGRL